MLLRLRRLSLLGEPFLLHRQLELGVFPPPSDRRLDLEVARMKEPAGVDFNPIGLAVLGQDNIAGQKQIVQGITDLRPIGLDNLVEERDVRRDELRFVRLNEIIQETIPDHIARFHFHAPTPVDAQNSATSPSSNASPNTS